MGTINNGLYTFFSLIICLIAKPGGTARGVDIHLFMFPHSASGAAWAEAERDLIYEESEGGGGRATAKCSCDTRVDPGRQSLENAELFVPHLPKKYVMVIISNF